MEFTKTTKLTDLSTLKLISYNGIREEVTLMINKANDYPNDSVYAFKSDSSLMQKHVKNYWLRLEPVYFYFKEIKGPIWKVRKSRAKVDTSVYGVFRITKRRRSLEDLESNSRLSKFYNVVADDDYFSAIPEVNDIAHWDNGIVYAGNIRLWSDATRNEQVIKSNYYNTALDKRIENWWSKSLNNWSDFHLSHDNLYNGEDILNMIDKIGHEEL